MNHEEAVAQCKLWADGLRSHRSAVGMSYAEGKELDNQETIKWALVALALKP